MVLRAAFAMYPTDAPLSHSFQNSNFDIRTLFHENKLGGLVNVSHRYINTNDSNAPDEARFAPNGDLYTKFDFYDFNR